MEYFKEPVIGVFMRDVSKEVFNFSLAKKNSKKKAKLKAMRFSNENVAHEMRTPLGSIIILISLLLSLGFGEQEQQRARKYTLQIKYLDQLLLTFVNDRLDYNLIMKEMFELTLERFDPKAAVESILDIFRVQASSQGVFIRFSIKQFLSSPVK